MEDGLAPEQATAAARQTFGNVTAARERFYEARRILSVDRLAQDIRCAVRNLRRFPVTTAVSVASLAAGIGATTVTLMVRDVLFYRAPPAYAEPAQLSRIQVGRPDRPIMPIGSDVPAPLYAAGAKRSATASPRQAWRAVSATCAPATAPKRRPYARPRQTSSQRSACRSQWARHPPPRSATARAPRQPCSRTACGSGCSMATRTCSDRASGLTISLTRLSGCCRSASGSRT